MEKIGFKTRLENREIFLDLLRNKRCCYFLLPHVRNRFILHLTLLFSGQRKQIPKFCVVADNISPGINNVSVVYIYLCECRKKSQEKSCKRTIRYQRPTPPVPATYADIRLPEEYKTTTNNHQFLQYDNYQNAKNRMSVFYFFMDGTFSVAPHPCKQLYTIRFHSKM